MNDPLLVSRFNGILNLRRNAQRFIDWNRAAGQSFGESFPVDELKDEKLRLFKLAKIENRRDMRMIQRRQHLRLTLESCDTVRIASERFRKYLDRYVTFQPQVARAIDITHAAGADETHNLVIADLSPQPGLAGDGQRSPRRTFHDRLLHEIAHAFFFGQKRFDFTAQIVVARARLVEERGAAVLVVGESPGVQIVNLLQAMGRQLDSS